MPPTPVQTVKIIQLIHLNTQSIIQKQ